MDLSRYPLVRASEAELLTRLMEECGEVIQAAAKCLRFGPGSRWPANAKRSNAEDVFAELKDVETIARELKRRLCGEQQSVMANRESALPTADCPSAGLARRTHPNT